MEIFISITHERMLADGKEHGRGLWWTSSVKRNAPLSFCLPFSSCSSFICARLVCGGLIPHRRHLYLAMRSLSCFASLTHSNRITKKGTKGEREREILSFHNATRHISILPPPSFSLFLFNLAYFSVNSYLRLILQKNCDWNTMDTTV